MTGTDHRRLDADAELFIFTFSDSQQLHIVTKPLGKSDIFLAHPGNPADTDIIQLHICAEAERTQNSHFARSIQAFHIRSRIRFRISQFLRFFKHIIVGGAFLAHFAQYVIGCTVHNPHDLHNFVGGKSFNQCTDNRNPAGYTGLIKYIALLLLRLSQNLRSMECHQVFISGYDMFTQLQRLKNIFLRSGDAAHHFDDHINFRITDEFPGICSDFGGINFDITRLIGILYSNAFNNNR
ncbi:hypothetical protein D3C75_580800 [compost metagenome]